MEVFNMALGETITTLRKQKGLSQEQLSEQLGLTRQTISKWELNQSTPDIEYIIRLSEIFEVTTDFLLKGKKEDPVTKEDNSSPIVIQNNKSNIKDIFGLCFGLGLTFSGLSFAGIIIFIVCSALNPWTTVEGSKVFTGVIGFVKGTETEGFFYLLLLILFVSFGFVLYGLAGRVLLSKSKQK